MLLIDTTGQGGEALQRGTGGSAHTVPQYLEGGNLAVVLNGAAVPVAFAAAPCKEVTVSNLTGVVVEVQQGAAGAYFPIAAGGIYTFYGLTNTSQLAARRQDLAVGAVTLAARWHR